MHNNLNKLLLWKLFVTDREIQLDYAELEMA
jgi:hypothetical protein